MFCNQSFIGGTYILSCQKCFLYKSISRLYTAHNLYYDIHFRIIHNLLIIMNQNLFYRLSREITKIQDIFYVKFLSGTSCNALFVCV